MATDGRNDIEAIRKERKVTRTLFTKTANVLEKLLELHSGDEAHAMTITGQYLKVLELQNQLTELDKQVRKLMSYVDDEDRLENEMETAMEYKSRWIMLDTKYKSRSCQHINNDNPIDVKREKRNFKLPTLQFTTFGGDLKGWLPFWGQFQKIDNDPQIDTNDKYQYLLQAMADGSEPKVLVESFTPTSYNECLSQLKSRYAREELLIQVYVRELLGLINKVESYNLTTLFDKINAMLRALETLGVTKDKFAAFLLPMVESALPQELLKVWERNKKENEDISTELNSLLTFMRKEVESEQRILLAKKTLTKLNSTPEPTASCLLTNTDGTNTKKNIICVWCEKDSHNSLECYKMQKMTIEDRRTYLKQKKACAICLKKGHHPKTCKAPVKCLLCGQRHSVVVCTGQTQKVSDNAPKCNLSATHTEATSRFSNTTSATASDETSSTTMSASTKKSTETTLLQTISVLLSNGEKQVMVRAMFDNGAQRSYIREDVAQKLNIPTVGNETLSHTLFGGVEITSKQYKVYDLNVSSLDKKFSFQLTALGQTCICQNIPKYTNNDISHLLTKHNITLSDKSTHSDDIGLLIGADFSGLVLTGDMVKLHDTLVAIKTKLGWTLQGKTTNSSMQAGHVAMFCSTDVSNFWSLENLGICDPIETKTKQQLEKEVLANFEMSVTINDEDRYEVLLPWKVGHDELLNNHDVASRRLQSVTKRMMVSNMYEDYNQVFNEWCDKGIIKIVPDPEKDIKSSHYLPHRPVVKEKSLTTKIRPVFDASAKDGHGKSLNLCLDKGINMLDKIPKLLNGFRKRAIGVTADISKAFLQISVSPRDRDMLRFLWWDEKGNMITYHHCRVVFGLTCSPFLLSASIQHHLHQVSGELRGTADILADSFYVDNCQTSLDTIEAVKKFETEARETMSQAKFDLTQWTIAPQPDQKDDAVISILGLEWHTKEDQLSCNIKDFPPSCELGKITKRNLLSLTQRIYDPIGFTSGVTLVPRLILQETWRRKLSWDEEIPGDLKNKFIHWYESLHYLKHCRIPRRLTTTPFDESTLQLHLFSDASQDGFAACLCLRSENKGIVSVRIISAKSRVAPPEKLTIPRLELLAALIGSRLLAEARRDLKLKCEERCWTDSGVALCWIKKELPWNTYVGNRVKEIRQNSNIDNWYHIPGASNWADLPSRGCDAAQLLSSRWLEGPSWLYSAPSEWPKSPLALGDLEASRELKKSVVCNTNSVPNEGMTSQLSHFSKYNKIIRMVTWMLRFAHNARYKIKIRGELSCEEYEESENRVMRIIQAENRDYIEKKIRGLIHFYDNDGLLKIKTKLLLSDFPETVKTPVLLPDNNIIVRRLVEQRHRELKHAGANQLTADIRARFWIIGIRRLTKSIIASCVVCTRFRSKSVQAPTAPLPSERIQCTAPFQVSGVDLAGPLFLRNGEKCWVVLYTCAVYRCVHLELTKSLSTEAFMLTLRRFIARRGRVKQLISDNGTNLVGTKNRLTEIDWEEVQKCSTIERIKWKMNAPTAAWWGGFFERLIRIMKDLLRRILGQSRVDYEELETILYESEAIMNQRPLTYVQDDMNTHLEPLTPLCFIQSIPHNDVTDLDAADAKTLNYRLKYLLKLREDFKQRFKTEYLTALVQRGKEKQTKLNVGDIVLIETEDKRVKWPLGIIDEIFTGCDNINRTAKVRTSTGIKVRPFQRLFPLEITDPEAEFPKHKESAPGKMIPNTYVPQADPEETPLLVPVVSPVSPSPAMEQDKAKEQTTRSGRVARLPSRYLI